MANDISKITLDKNLLTIDFHNSEYPVDSNLVSYRFDIYASSSIGVKVNDKRLVIYYLSTSNIESLNLTYKVKKIRELDHGKREEYEISKPYFLANGTDTSYINSNYLITNQEDNKDINKKIIIEFNDSELSKHIKNEKIEIQLDVIYENIVNYNDFQGTKYYFSLEEWDSEDEVWKIIDGTIPDKTFYDLISRIKSPKDFYGEYSNSGENCISNAAISIPYSSEISRRSPFKPKNPVAIKNYNKYTVNSNVLYDFIIDSYDSLLGTIITPKNINFSNDYDIENGEAIHTVLYTDVDDSFNDVNEIEIILQLSYVYDSNGRSIPYSNSIIPIFYSIIPTPRAYRTYVINPPTNEVATGFNIDGVSYIENGTGKISLNNVSQEIKENGFTVAIRNFEKQDYKKFIDTNKVINPNEYYINYIRGSGSIDWGNSLYIKKYNITPISTETSWICEATEGNWDDPVNWSNGVPTFNTVARFDRPVNSTCNISGNIICRYIDIQNAFDGEFIFNNVKILFLFAETDNLFDLSLIQRYFLNKDVELILSGSVTLIINPVITVNNLSLMGRFNFVQNLSFIKEIFKINDLTLYENTLISSHVYNNYNLISLEINGNFYSEIKTFMELDIHFNKANYILIKNWNSLSKNVNLRFSECFQTEPIQGYNEYVTPSFTWQDIESNCYPMHDMYSTNGDDKYSGRMIMPKLFIDCGEKDFTIKLDNIDYVFDLIRITVSNGTNLNGKIIFDMENAQYIRFLGDIEVKRSEYGLISNSHDNRSFSTVEFKWPKSAMMDFRGNNIILCTAYKSIIDNNATMFFENETDKQKPPVVISSDLFEIRELNNFYGTSILTTEAFNG